ncbi:MAG: hypothetical protein HYV16_10520 [Gammaproteobacteria bacterium]|nr:hypothetical protein [Gammaproteobacteria bacterium]
MSTAFSLRNAMEETAALGKPRWRQVLDMLRLALPPNRLSPLEYYSFRLFDDAAHPWPDKRRFLGRRSKIYRHLRHRDWYALAEDKLLFQAVMEGLGFPVPRLLAVYARDGRRHGGVPGFTDKARLAQFLRLGMPYPCFGKPVQGVYGQGAMLAEAYEPDGDSLRLAGGGRVPVAACVEGLLDVAGRGYLFQEVLPLPEDYGPWCGAHLPCFRIDLLLDRSGPRLQFVKLMLPADGNIVCNFRGGSLGNLIALMDPGSGRLEPAISAYDWRGTCTVDRHPQGSLSMTGQVPPGWAAVRELAMGMAPHFPGLRQQSWDIAYTGRGPVALELNLGGDSLYFGQFLAGRGVLDEALLTLAASLPFT